MKQYIILLILLVSGVLTAAPAFAQKSGTKHTVTGKVTDQSGEPLIGATVLVTGTTNGASTNATGDYSIQVPEGASLTFQYIGYEAKTEKVGARTKVDVKLEQSKQTIDEVVVIGYGTVKKTDLTGSVANVKMSDIKDVPVVSVDQALQGRIAGADIMATTGEPGATTSIRIRGTRSISASNEPLIIVDGVIDGIHDLNDINSGHRVDLGAEGRLVDGHLRLTRLERRDRHHDQEGPRHRRTPQHHLQDRPGIFAAPASARHHGCHGVRPLPQRLRLFLLKRRRQR